MISIDAVIKIHSALIERYGGLPGIQDKGAVMAAISRPYQTFDSNELYPTPIDKAAAVFESIISNHPFLDGNKRTAYTLMRMALNKYNLTLNTALLNRYNFVMQAASGQLSFDEIKAWITQNTITVK
jgi:death on curing protein